MAKDIFCHLVGRTCSGVAFIDSIVDRIKVTDLIVTPPPQYYWPLMVAQGQQQRLWGGRTHISWKFLQPKCCVQVQPALFWCHCQESVVSTIWYKNTIVVYWLSKHQHIWSTTDRGKQYWYWVVYPGEIHWNLIGITDLTWKQFM